MGGMGGHPVRLGLETPLDEVVDVDQRDQFSRLRLWREPRNSVHEIRRQRRPLVVLNDADDHRCGVAGGGGDAEQSWELPGRRQRGTESPDRYCGIDGGLFEVSIWGRPARTRISRQARCRIQATLPRNAWPEWLDIIPRMRKGVWLRMERIGFRVPEGFTAREQNFYPKLSAREFIERFQEQLDSGEPIQLGYLKNVFISVEKDDDTIVMVLLSGLSRTYLKNPFGLVQGGSWS